MAFGTPGLPRPCPRTAPSSNTSVHRGDSPWLSRGLAGGAPPDDCGGTAAGSSWDSAMVAVARGIVQRPGATSLRMFKYGDNLRHGQCTDGAVDGRWSGNCSTKAPGNGRGGGFVTLDLRVDGFASIGPASTVWSVRVSETKETPLPLPRICAGALIGCLVPLLKTSSTPPVISRCSSLLRPLCLFLLTCAFLMTSSHSKASAPTPSP